MIACIVLVIWAVLTEIAMQLTFFSGVKISKVAFFPDQCYLTFSQIVNIFLDFFSFNISQSISEIYIFNVYFSFSVIFVMSLWQKAEIKLFYIILYNIIVVLLLFYKLF